MIREWRWIVMDGEKPLRRYSDGNYYISSYAEEFFTWADAHRVRAAKRLEYLKHANAAPSAESPAFKLWMERAERIRLVRIARLY